MSPVRAKASSPERRTDPVPMSNSPSDRRRSARIAVHGEVVGRVARRDELVMIREMSLEGMSIESAIRFEPGSIADFVLTLGDGASVEVEGTVVYTRPVEGAQPPLFVTGIQFNDPDESRACWQPQNAANTKYVIALATSPRKCGGAQPQPAPPVAIAVVASVATPTSIAASALQRPARGNSSPPRIGANSVTIIN